MTKSLQTPPHPDLLSSNKKPWEVGVRLSLYHFYSEKISAQIDLIVTIAIYKCPTKDKKGKDKLDP